MIRQLAAHHVEGGEALIGQLRDQEVKTAYSRELYTLLDPMIDPIKNLLADPEISEIFI